jgi:hypothetical protein
MTTIEEARLQKAREIAAERWTASDLEEWAKDALSGRDDADQVVQAALAALNFANWQPPEGSDERAARDICAKYGVVNDHSKRAVRAAYKAGKAAR